MKSISDIEGYIEGYRSEVFKYLIIGGGILGAIFAIATLSYENKSAAIGTILGVALVGLLWGGAIGAALGWLIVNAIRIVRVIVIITLVVLGIILLIRILIQEVPI